MVLVSLGGIGERGEIGGRSGSDPVHRCILEFLQQLGRVVKVLVAVLMLGLLLHRFPCYRMGEKNDEGMYSTLPQRCLVVLSALKVEKT